MAMTPFGFGPAGMFDPFQLAFGRGSAARDPLDVANLFPLLSTAAPTVSAHPLDVYETSDAFKITVDAPGMDANDINITMQEGVLTIAGKKKQEMEEKDKEGRVLRRERAFTSFSRSFTLPENVKEDEISASLHNGVLELKVPKVAPPPKAEPKRIQVHTVRGGEEAPKVMHHAAGAGQPATTS